MYVNICVYVYAYVYVCDEKEKGKEKDVERDGEKEEQDQEDVWEQSILGDYLLYTEHVFFYRGYMWFP